ncbi:hypothetical protein M5C99_21410 [Acidovorax sp. NCPPB 2350]|nr:hypothetical protein M5C99_21410 [Acidovorax sp. NCPPB 2350]
MTLDDVIRGDWASEPGVTEACLAVWRALSTRDHQLDHYTFDELARLANSDSEAVVSKALLYLASPKLKVLRTCLMYEFNGGIFELPEEEVSHYSKGEDIIHPEFGTPISDSEILVCFTPGPSLRPEERA